MTRYQYAGPGLVAEYDANGTLLRRYVHGPGTDQPIVWYEGSDTANRRFLMADERGSITSVADSAGTILAINRYDGAAGVAEQHYGIPASTNIGRFGYTGQTWLPEITMWHYRARIYSPTLGRFLQTDPIGYGDGLNMYAYVSGDPVNFVDPLGLGAEDIVVTGRREPGLPGFGGGSGGAGSGFSPDGCDRPGPQVALCPDGGGGGSALSSEIVEEDIFVRLRRRAARALRRFAEYLPDPEPRQPGEGFLECVDRVAGLSDMVGLGAGSASLID